MFSSLRRQCQDELRIVIAHEGRRDTTVVHEVAESGKLYFLLNAFIGAYNRRTDVMERAVKLDERIRGVTQKLDAAGESLKQTVKNNQPDKEN